MEHDPIIRKTIALPARMWSEIADFRFSERIATEAEAMRRLLQMALKAERKKAKAA